MKRIKSIISFLKNDIWKIRTTNLPRKEKILINQGRIILRTFGGFQKDNCVLRASSLTFFTLLSIVPVFAMAFGVAKGFNLQGMLESQLRHAFEGMQGHEELLQKILTFSQNQLQKTEGGVVAGIGVIFLFWTIVKLLSNIEWAFNEIWGIKNNRKISRKIADYLIIIIVFPFFLAVSGSVTAFISAQPGILMQKYEIFRILGPFFIVALKLLPLFILTPLFTFLYVFMPNTKVSLNAGFIAGLCTAICFMMLQVIYFQIQITLFTNYSAVYGSFAAMPLFLLWLEISWMIVLFGAETAYAIQNVDTFEHEEDSHHATRKFKKRLAVYLTSIIVEYFEKGKPAPTASELSVKLQIPLRFTHIVLHDLTKAGIIVKIVDEQDNNENPYLPALPDQKLTIQYIIDRLDEQGTEDIPFEKNEKFETIAKAIETLETNCRKSKANLRLDKI